MNSSELRLQQLQQIPVLALRELIGRHLDDPILGPVIRERFKSVLHRQPRDFRRALQRLTREHLTALIATSPEICDDEIAQQFEEHRYGISPSFYIYLFDPIQLDRAALTGSPAAAVHRDTAVGGRTDRLYQPIGRDRHGRQARTATGRRSPAGPVEALDER